MARRCVVLAIGIFALGLRGEAQEAVRWSDGTADMVLYPRRERDYLFLADVPLAEEKTSAWGAILDAAATVLHRDLGLTGKPERTRFYLFRDPGRYAAFVRHYLPNLPAGAAAARHGLFLRRNGISCVFLRLDGSVEETMRHEYVHVLLNRQVRMPLWLDEGLAYHYQGAGKGKGGAGPVRMEVLHRLESLRDLRQMDRSDYEAARGIVAYLLERPQGRHLLREYLADLVRDPEAAPLSRRLGSGPGSLRRTGSLAPG